MARIMLITGGCRSGKSAYAQQMAESLPTKRLYVATAPVSDEDTKILKKDFLGMLRAGANIYYMAKMAIPRGTSVQDAGAQFQGITTKEFQAKLLAKADGLIEKIKQREGYWNG